VSKEVSKRISNQLLTAIALFTVACSIRVNAQNNAIDNARIIKMVSLGLDDEIIVAKIKTSKCSFEMADDDLLKLAKGGISPKVQAAMMEANKVTVTRVVIDKKPVDLRLFAQLHMTQQLLSLSKTRASLPGKHSSVIVGQTPEIFMELAPGDEIRNYILVQLDGKDNHRELPLATSALGKVMGYPSNTGDVSKEAIRPTAATPLGEGKFKITPATPLKPGEYLICVVGTYEFLKRVFAKGYDFTVQ
jgi:hypothetical protein